MGPDCKVTSVPFIFPSSPHQFPNCHLPPSFPGYSYPDLFGRHGQHVRSVGTFACGKIKCDLVTTDTGTSHIFENIRDKLHSFQYEVNHENMYRKHRKTYTLGLYNIHTWNTISKL